MYKGGCVQVICKYYSILHAGLEHLQGSWNQFSKDTEEQMDSHSSHLTAGKLSNLPKGNSKLLFS